jgi:ribosome maturation factor RimP
MAQDLQARLRALAEPLVDDAGLDLVALEVKGAGGAGGAGGARMVRVVVDRKGGVDLRSCQELSRTLSDVLDASDPIEGRYALEVTSPGVDHPLVGRRAFERVEGRDVLIHREQAGRVLQVRGTVVGADDTGVTVEVDGAPVQVPYDEVVKATQALPW